MLCNLRILTVFLGAVLLLVSSSSCDRSDEERCDDLEAIIEARALENPSICSVDSDCTLYQVHPGKTVGVARIEGDSDLDVALERHGELCEAFAPSGTTYKPVCIRDRCYAEAIAYNAVDLEDEDPGDVPDMSGDDMSEEDMSEGDMGLLPDTPPEPDLGECACAGDTDCAEGDVCLDGCVCESLCQATCQHLENCGQLQTLGLGSDVSNCVDLCERSVGNPTGSSRVRCFLDLACDADFTDCF